MALVSGGGAGRELLHAGFLGSGKLSAVAPGLVFSSPNALQIHAAMRAADQGAGVRHLVKNYTGDVMNFAVGADLSRADGIDVETVLIEDDAATDGDAFGPGRRGTAAAVIVEKVCGAAAARGWSLARVAEIGRKVAANSRSMAIALRPSLARYDLLSTCLMGTSRSASEFTGNAGLRGRP